MIAPEENRGIKITGRPKKEEPSLLRAFFKRTVKLLAGNPLTESALLLGAWIRNQRKKIDADSAKADLNAVAMKSAQDAVEKRDMSYGVLLEKLLQDGRKPGTRNADQIRQKIEGLLTELRLTHGGSLEIHMPKTDGDTEAVKDLSTSINIEIPEEEPPFEGENDDDDLDEGQEAAG